MTADPGLGSARRMGGRAVWTIGDQVLSSLANFGLTIAVARAVDQEMGGAFAYVFLVFTFGVGISRAVAVDPMTIRYSAEEPALRRAAIRRAASSSLGLGVLAGAGCAVVGALLGGVMGLALLLLAVVLPGHFLQDAWRNAAFADQAPQRAAANDGLRVVIQFAGVALCEIAGTDTLVWFMVSWALGVWVAAAFGAWQFGGLAGARAALAWLRESASLGLRLGGGFAVNMGAITLVTSLLASILGLVATGGLRFAQSILGPIQLLFGALTAFMVPALARRLAESGPHSLRRPAGLAAAAASAVAALVVAALLLIPDAWGQEILGASWAGAREVMLPTGLVQFTIAVTLAGSLPLTALGRADLILRISLVQAPLMLVLGVGGIAVGGVHGAAWGLAAAQGTGSLVTLVLARRATRSRRVPTAPTAPATTPSS